MEAGTINALIVGACSIIGMYITSKYTKNADVIKLKEQIKHFSEISDNVRLEAKIDNLSRDVKKHNNLVERIYKLEGCVQSNTIKIDDLRR